MGRALPVFVIMAGGKGERLWPLVRAGMPKVCLRADGVHTLLDATLTRLAPLATPRNTLIITTRDQTAMIRHSLPRAFRPSVIVEPEPKNTAGCISMAAAIVAARATHTVMCVLPADHWIPDAAAFWRSLGAAVEVAAAHPAMAMIGVRPSRVHPGLGHLCVGPRLGRQQARLPRDLLGGQGCQVFRLARFIEKPSPKAAQQLMRQRRVFWNAGIFVGQAGTFLSLIRRWLPEHARFLGPLGERFGRADFAKQAKTAYRALQAISFDDGVMAHMREGYVVEGDFVWEDLGSWESWARIRRLNAPSIVVDSRNVQTLSTDGHLVATVGLKDVIVVHTPDATLVCHARSTQAVRTVTAQLSQDQRMARYA